MAKKDYEVVIVGAGPAGLNAAITLAKAGRKVLVLEKNRIVGPKVCAGGVVPSDVDDLKLPKEIIGYYFKNIILYTPLLKKTYSKLSRSGLYTVDRKALGQWMLKKAKDAGAEVRTGSQVTAIGNNELTVNDKEILQWKYLIGADGSNSLVRRHLGLSTKRFITTLQYSIPRKIKSKENLEDMEFHLIPGKFGVGYAWIFPHKDYVAVGCGSESKGLKQGEIMKNFKVWMEKNNIHAGNARLEGFIINVDYQGYMFGDIYLVGDAAGLASPLTGGGIHQGLVSGEEVAKLIIDTKYTPIKLKKVISEKARDDRTVWLLGALGIFRAPFIELFALFSRTKKQ